jgi:general secretion pathway protein G
MRNEKGFTLIELLIVVAIIGIIAAIAIPNLLNALDRARQTKTVAHLRTLGEAIEQYITDYPSIGSPKSADATALATLLASQGYLKNAETVMEDGWGNDMVYQPVAALKDRHFTIMSYGSDGAVGPDPVTAGIVKRFQEDIVFTDKGFTQKPEGAQTDE